MAVTFNSSGTKKSQGSICVKATGEAPKRKQTHPQKIVVN